MATRFAQVHELELNVGMCLVAQSPFIESTDEPAGTQRITPGMVARVQELRGSSVCLRWDHNGSVSRWGTRGILEYCQVVSSRFAGWDNDDA